MKRPTQPPLSASDAADLLPPSSVAKSPVEKVVRSASADVEKPSIDALLPPGAEDQAEAPPARATQPSFALQNTATRAAQRAERRLWKNAIMFGFFIVVLIVVFYFLAR